MIVKKTQYHFVLLGILALILFVADIMIGAVHIPFQHIIHSLINSADTATDIIIFQSRLPKAITAVFVGIALPVAGLLMQTFFRNPVAGPDILGITSGASLMVAILLMSTGGVLTSFISFADNISIILAGVTGSVLVLLLMLIVASRLTDTVTLLIFGLMFGTAISAVVGMLQYFSEKEALKLFVLWSYGSISGVTWAQLVYLIPVIIIAVFLAVLNSKSLNILLLGEIYARSLGLHVRRMRIFFICITGVLTGAITAFCGPIAFVGIAVPHLARILFKTSDHLKLMPASILIGICVMLFCDMISQLPGTELVLPLNTVTAFLGAPFVIYILFRDNKLQRYFS